LNALEGVDGVEISKGDETGLDEMIGESRDGHLASLSGQHRPGMQVAAHPLNHFLAVAQGKGSERAILFRHRSIGDGTRRQVCVAVRESVGAFAEQQQGEQCTAYQFDHGRLLQQETVDPKSTVVTIAPELGNGKSLSKLFLDIEASLHKEPARMCTLDGAIAAIVAKAGSGLRLC
jgi:hypothetical protein